MMTIYGLETKHNSAQMRNRIKSIRGLPMLILVGFTITNFKSIDRIGPFIRIPFLNGLDTAQHGDCGRRRDWLRIRLDFHRARR